MTEAALLWNIRLWKLLSDVNFKSKSRRSGLKCDPPSVTLRWGRALGAGERTEVPNDSVLNDVVRAGLRERPRSGIVTEITTDQRASEERAASRVVGSTARQTGSQGLDYQPSRRPPPGGDFLWTARYQRDVHAPEAMGVSRHPFPTLPIEPSAPKQCAAPTHLT